MGCLLHKWDGCKCSKCGKTRDEHHLWKCGVCELCGKKAPLMGHESGIRKLNGSNVETYCSKCNTLFKTEPENVLYDSVIRRLRDAESAGCSDPEAEIILEWLREAAKR